MSRSLRICGVALLLCIGAPVFADEASHAAEAEKFLKLTNADRIAVPVHAQVQQMFAQRFSQTQAPITQKATLERYQAKADAELEKAIGWDKLEPELVKLYTETFSEAELKELMAFYKTPLGNKVLAQMPQLAGRSAQIAQAHLQPAVPQVNKLLNDMTAELQAAKPAEKK
jgi:hypothetical protein